MATVLLVRHGRTTANATGLLAGRTAGVHLDRLGGEQVALAGDRIAAVPVAQVVSSSSRALRGDRPGHPRAPEGRTVVPTVDPELTECDYGQWQGRRLSE